MYMPSYSGTFKLAGGNANPFISFMEVKYTVVFQEAGLPDGTQWYINGTSNISASSQNLHTSQVDNLTFFIQSFQAGIEYG